MCMELGLLTSRKKNKTGEKIEAAKPMTFPKRLKAGWALCSLQMKASCINTQLSKEFLFVTRANSHPFSIVAKARLLSAVDSCLALCVDCSEMALLTGGATSAMEIRSTRTWI